MRWGMVGDIVVITSLAAYTASLAVRVASGDLLTSAESSVITQALIFGTLTAGFVFQQIGRIQARRDQRRKDVQEREDRTRRDQEFQELLEARAKVASLEADKRHGETLDRIAETHAITVTALDASNHANEKIVTLTERVDQTLQVAPAIVAAAVAEVVKATSPPSLERTPGTVLTETRRSIDRPKE